MVAGGTGQRFGGPKQFERLGPRRVLDHAVEAARRASGGVVVVVPAAAVAAEQLEQAGIGGVLVVAGGATRSESVRAGLAAVPADATVVCVHDAARPFATRVLFDAVIGAVQQGADGAVPGVAVSDTIKQVDENDVVVVTPRRDRLVAVQTPQAFRASVLRAVHRQGTEATDDAALVERGGGTVVVVPGDPTNRKITHPDDLAWARERVVEEQR